MSKKIILIIIIVLLLAVGIYQGFLKTEEPTFTLVEVVRGNISQEVAETGQVKKGEEINLSFKNSGRIEKIYVEAGDQVESGENLAKLEITQLAIQLQEAKAVLSLAQSKLDKLLAGASPEEIQVVETAVSNAKIALESAQQNLEDTKALAEEDLNADYGDALNTSDDSYLKIYNAFNVADLIQRTYFITNDQEGIRVRENKDKIENTMTQAKSYLDVAKADPKNENIDVALSEIKKALEETYNALRIIREICQTPTYRNAVSSADKTSLDTQRGYVNTALTNITNSQQTISSTKLTNEADINTAQASVSTAQGSLAAAEDELSLLIAPPREEDVDLYQAQVRQAEAQVQILENQIKDATLKSPTQGQITKINKKVGELIQSMLQDAVITLLPAAPFEIEVDIYEEDVVKINIGNQVDISLVAFPGQEFLGKVISIEPTEKLTEGVVYYQITIAFEEMPEGIKPGMTADLIIKTESRENVLIIPEDALQKRDGKQIVEVFKDGISEDREIEVGLFGSDGMVEVISGIEEGEKLILR